MNLFYNHEDSKKNKKGDKVARRRSIYQKTLKKLTFPAMLALAGLLGAWLFTLDYTYLYRQVTGNSEVEVSQIPEEEVGIIPQIITIPSQNIVAEIRPAKVNEDIWEWEIFEDAVSWMETSGTIQEGNMVLYGHNKRSLLKDITKVKVDDIIEITSGNQTYEYKVTLSYEGSRNDVDIIKDTGNDRLTIYTCSGWLDNERYFLIAERV